MAASHSTTPQVIDRLPPHLSPGAMAQLLSHVKDTPCDLLLDGSKVARLDQLGLQILMVLHQTQVTRSNAFQIEDPSSALLDGLTLFGLDPDSFTKDAP